MTLLQIDLQIIPRCRFKNIRTLYSFIRNFMKKGNIFSKSSKFVARSVYCIMKHIFSGWFYWSVPGKTYHMLSDVKLYQPYIQMYRQKASCHLSTRQVCHGDNVIAFCSWKWHFLQIDPISLFSASYLKGAIWINIWSCVWFHGKQIWLQIRLTVK